MGLDLLILLFFIIGLIYVIRRKNQLLRLIKHDDGPSKMIKAFRGFLYLTVGNLLAGVIVKYFILSELSNPLLSLMLFYPFVLSAMLTFYTFTGFIFMKVDFTRKK